MVSLARTGSGLLYQSDGSLTGWSSAGQWASVSTVRFVASLPIPMRPGAIPISQMFGEPKMTVVGSQWYLLYDDAVLPGRLSRSALQVSNDRGITWVDLGPFTFSSPQTQSGITLAGPYLDPNDGNWYQGAFSANTGIADSGGIFGPGSMYLFKSTTGIQGPYTQISTIATPSGSCTAGGLGPGGMIWDGTNYNLYVGGIPAAAISSSVILTALYQSTTWTGTFTQPNPTVPIYDGPVDGPNLTAVTQNGVEGQNICYNPTLSLYVMICASTIAGGVDFSTLIQTSSSLTFPTSGWKHIQWVGADFNLLVSIGNIMNSGTNSQAATGPNGEMTIFSADQRPNWTDVGSPFLHYTGLLGKFATLEPASAVLRYTGSTDQTPRQLTRNLAHTDITIECGCELTGVNGSGGAFIIAYRSDSGGANQYQAQIGTGGVFGLVKGVGGSFATAVSGTGSQLFANQGATLGMIHRMKIQVIGNTHMGWLDGELQYTFTDTSSPITSGVQVWIYGLGINCDVINFSCRTSDTITVNGMQPNTSCWLRAACGVPVMSITANSSGVGTVTYQHFPLFSLDIGNVDYTVGSDSRIWGGDVLQFSGLSNATPTVPLAFNNI